MSPGRMQKLYKLQMRSSRLMLLLWCLHPKIHTLVRKNGSKSTSRRGPSAWQPRESRGARSSCGAFSSHKSWFFQTLSLHHMCSWLVPVQTVGFAPTPTSRT